MRCPDVIRREHRRIGVSERVIAVVSTTHRKENDTPKQDRNETIDSSLRTPVPSPKVKSRSVGTSQYLDAPGQDRTRADGLSIPYTRGTMRVDTDGPGPGENHGPPDEGIKPASQSVSRLVISSGLAVLALLALGRIVENDFITLDDVTFVLQNPPVRSGLTRGGLFWSWTTTYASQWQPVTWLSHMLNCELFGLAPWGHHLTSLLVHIASSVMLFLLLDEMTGARWTSVLQAAVFAIHPLRVGCLGR